MQAMSEFACVIFQAVAEWVLFNNTTFYDDLNYVGINLLLWTKY